MFDYPDIDPCGQPCKVCGMVDAIVRYDDEFGSFQGKRVCRNCGNDIRE